MTTKSSFEPGHFRELSISYDAALARLPEALKHEGFGVITEIDLQATFKAKLGIDFRRYRILGACNPSFAHRALQADTRVGVLLPCNVALYETDEGKAIVGAVNPMQTLDAGVEGSALAEVAREVGERLERVLAGLS
ncbi:MAG TPA: DUF302 domain-containing protein [Polyangiales bacterium]